MQKPTIAVLVDTLDWAYGSHFKDLVRFFPEFEFEAVVGVGVADTEAALPAGKFDAVYSLGLWWAPRHYPKEHCGVSIRSMRQHEPKANRKLWEFGDSPQVLMDACYRRVYGLSDEIVDFYRPMRADIVYLPSGIDTDTFRPPSVRPKRDRLIVGWAGKRQGWKRVEWIEAACEGLRGVELRLAERKTERWIPWEQMPEWFKELDVYVCASKAKEGSNRSSLEAMACGVPLLTTICGEAPRLVGDNCCGWPFYDGVPELRRWIKWMRDNPRQRLEMGQHARARIEGGWSWRVLHERYVKVFDDLLRGDD